MIVGLDQRFTNSITFESCATPHVVQNSAAPPSQLEAQTRAPTVRLPPKLIPLPESASTPAPLIPSSSSRTTSPDYASNPGPSASAMTTDAPIDLVTQAGLPLDSPAPPISFSSWNTLHLQWPTSQTCVASPELSNVETLPRNVMIDPRDVPRQAPEDTSSHWSPQPPFARISQPIVPILVSARTSLPNAPILASGRTSSPIAPILVSERFSPPIAPILVFERLSSADRADTRIRANCAANRADTRIRANFSAVFVDSSGTALADFAAPVPADSSSAASAVPTADFKPVSTLSADQRSLDSRRSRSPTADVRECRGDPLGTTKDAVLCILRPRIHARRPQICTSTRAYCQSWTVRASEEQCTL